MQYQAHLTKRNGILTRAELIEALSTLWDKVQFTNCDGATRAEVYNENDSTPSFIYEICDY